MKKIRPIALSVLMFLVLRGPGQTVPFNLLPDWISTANGHIATGLGLADINGDGWKDLVVANGNDIQRQHLVVYYNQGDGTFPLNPDWQSADIDYHGHLACGDIDQDGDMDVAVSVYIGETGFGSPGRVKVYYNEGGQLEASPSFISDPYYTFSCALGDADGDGDLDLATTAGEPYNDILDHGKIFINDGGTFQVTAEWQSDIEMGSLDVEFGDINRDGFMDLIFVCENTSCYIYPGSSAGISTAPAWQSAESVNYINSVDIAYRGDDESIVVMTENSQLGGQGRVRRYLFSNPLPAMSQADWYSSSFGYGSGILLADIDTDSTLDLVYGGWWLPVNIALGEPGGFQLLPAYTSSTSSVVEAIQMADLGRESMMDHTYTTVIDEAHAGSHILILPDQLAEEITDIKRNGDTVYPTEFCFVPGKPWLSFTQAFSAGDLFHIHYNGSPHPDMVITNWDSSKGNYIFYNTSSPVGTEENGLTADEITLFPNPARDYITLKSNSIEGSNARIVVTDAVGKVMITKVIEWKDGEVRMDISKLAAGIYLVKYEKFTRILIKNR